MYEYTITLKIKTEDQKGILDVVKYGMESGENIKEHGKGIMKVIVSGCDRVEITEIAKKEV